MATGDSELGSVHRRHCHCWRYGWSWGKVDNSLAKKYTVSSEHFNKQFMLYSQINHSLFKCLKRLGLSHR